MANLFDKVAYQLGLRSLSRVRGPQGVHAPTLGLAGDSRRLVWDTVKELRRQNARADECRIGELLAGLMEGDDDLRGAGALLLAHDALVAERVARQRPTSTPRQRAERQAAERKAVAAIAKKVRETVLLDQMVTLATGQKQLRYATKKELDQLGGLYVQLAARLETPDEMCGERWTEGSSRRCCRQLSNSLTVRLRT